MYALLVVLMSAGSLTSSTIYFQDKYACEAQATFLSTDLRANVQEWINHAYIHCMPLSLSKAQ